MRYHKDIDKAGTVEFRAVIVVEQPAGYIDGQPWYDIQREVAADFTVPTLAAAKRWLKNNLKTYGTLHKTDDALIEGRIDKVTWCDAYIENDPKFGLLKLTDDEYEEAAYGTVWYDSAAVRVTVEEY